MDSSSSHTIGAARDVTPPGSRRSRRRRRPTGEPPPLPRHLESTGVGWMVAALGLVILQTAKAWFIDRMVLLFEHMKAGSPEYAAWEY